MALQGLRKRRLTKWYSGFLPEDECEAGTSRTIEDPEFVLTVSPVDSTIPVRQPHVDQQMLATKQSWFRNHVHERATSVCQQTNR